MKNRESHELRNNRRGQKRKKNKGRQTRHRLVECARYEKYQDYIKHDPQKTRKRRNKEGKPREGRWSDTQLLILCILSGVITLSPLSSSLSLFDSVRVEQSRTQWGMSTLRLDHRLAAVESPLRMSSTGVVQRPDNNVDGFLT